MLKFFKRESIAILVFITIYSVDVFSYVRFKRSLDEYFFPTNFFSDDFIALIFVSAFFISFGLIAYKSLNIKDISPGNLIVLRIVSAVVSIVFHSVLFIAYIIWFRLRMGLSL